MTHASLEFQPLTESDLPLLHSWLNRPQAFEPLASWPLPMGRRCWWFWTGQHGRLPRA